MNVLVILAHPHPGSFNHAIAGTVVDQLRSAGHDVGFHDLYAERFDPILPHGEMPKEAQPHPAVGRYCEEVVAAGGYVIVHPNWWGQPPAILKGWLDRVLRQGVAYEFGPNGVVELLRAKRAVVFTTSNTPRDAELELFGDPLENLWKNCVFGFCGVKEFLRRNFEPVILSTPEQRSAWLSEVRQIIAQRFPADA